MLHFLRLRPRWLHWLHLPCPFSRHRAVYSKRQSRQVWLALAASSFARSVATIYDAIFADPGDHHARVAVFADGPLLARAKCASSWQAILACIFQVGLSALLPISRLSWSYWGAQLVHLVWMRDAGARVGWAGLRRSSCRPVDFKNRRNRFKLNLLVISEAIMRYRRWPWWRRLQLPLDMLKIVLWVLRLIKWLYVSVLRGRPRWPLQLCFISCARRHSLLGTTGCTCRQVRVQYIRVPLYQSSLLGNVRMVNATRRVVHLLLPILRVVQRPALGRLVAIRVELGRHVVFLIFLRWRSRNMKGGDWLWLRVLELGGCCGLLRAWID